MIAIIPARGGSKGLPGKNIKQFLGKPMIAHTIEAALSSSPIDRVVVSTDDAAIAAVARDYGAEVPFLRPAELATDTATSRDVILHAIDFLEANGAAFDVFCLLQPTSPLRSAADIDRAASVFKEKSGDSVLSLVAYEHPIQWAMEVDEMDGKIVPIDRFQGIRRQDLAKYYRPNGAIYIFKKAFYQTHSDYSEGEVYGYVMASERSFDIDTEYDFIAAEAIGQHIGYLTNNE